MGSDRPPADRPLVDRREVLRRTAASGLGLVLPGHALAAPVARPLVSLDDNPRADAVIHVILDGGLSHLDSFDPKPYAPVEVRSSFGSLRSTLDGERLSGLMRRTARIANRLTILRAMTHGEAAHERGKHTTLTGYPPSPAIVYPSFGSVFSHELGGRRSLPPYVAIPSDREPSLGTGYLGAAHGPFSVGGEPSARNFRVRDLDPRPDVDAKRRERRRHLVDLVDDGFDVGGDDGVQALESFYDQAYALIENESARKAFDIRAEPRKTRELYGYHGIGQRMLLARRLARSGTRYVAVQQGGYDSHRDLRRSLRTRLQQFDQALAALVTDLERTGELDRTLVVVTTEFGRTPRLNRDRGRDHWPRCFSCVAVGGGIRKGLVHGRSDAEGASPEDGATSPADLAATMFHLAGIDPTRRLPSPGNRPIDIVRDGRILKEILA